MQITGRAQLDYTKMGVECSLCQKCCLYVYSSDYFPLYDPKGIFPALLDETTWTEPMFSTTAIVQKHLWKRCVLPGAQSKEKVKKLLAYYEQSEDALDYSVVGTFEPPEASGKCVYCNHCKPCLVGIDIGLVNKYYDLAKSGDALAVEHYRTLEVNADNCIGCGHCDEHCPFGVRQSGRMSEIRDYFN